MTTRSMATCGVVSFPRFLVLAGGLLLSSVGVADRVAAQSPMRQVTDTGVRNTLPGRPMGPVRSAGGMADMAGMEGMEGGHAMPASPGKGAAHDAQGMTGMPGMGGTPEMAGMDHDKDSAAMPGMERGHDMSSPADSRSALQAMMALQARMLADPVIRGRVMSDTTLRRLAERAEVAVTADSAAHAKMEMEHGAHDGMAGEGRRKDGGGAARATPKRGAARAPAKGTKNAPASPRKGTAKPAPKKAPPPPMPGMDHSKMPGMGKP